jgi:hypothetical protein
MVVLHQHNKSRPNSHSKVRSQTGIGDMQVGIMKKYAKTLAIEPISSFSIECKNDEVLATTNCFISIPYHRSRRVLEHKGSFDRAVASFGILEATKDFRLCVQ